MPYLFMAKNSVQEAFLFVAPLILGFVCLIGSASLLPENCLLYEYRQIGFLCDGISIENPQPCPICRDEAMAAVSRVIFAFGFVFLIVPFAVSAIRLNKNYSEQNKIFDKNIKSSNE